MAPASISTATPRISSTSINRNLARALRPYQYHLPATRIAQRPAVPRDAAKLLVIDRAGKQTTISRFRRLGMFLPAGAVVVVNDTKVVPARLSVRKPTGGRVELLVLDTRRTVVEVLANSRLLIGQSLTIGGKFQLRVVRQSGHHFWLRPNFPSSRWPVLLRHYGTTPLPPYLKHSPLSERERRQWYQAIFAKQAGSIAAPTASLHFTPRLLKQLQRTGHPVIPVTLQVNLGTFAPLTVAQLRTGRLYLERYAISPAAAARLNAAKQAGRPIIAVGTTVARTLESATRHGRLKKLQGSTDLFIRPGYRWKFVDGVITNFHVPGSSLLMLVASLIGRRRLFQLYQLARRKNFTFLSFGDAMFIR